MAEYVCIYPGPNYRRKMANAYIVFITWIYIWIEFYQDVQCRSSTWVADAGQGVNYDYITSFSEGSWFDAAQSTCQYYGGHLLVTPVTNISDSGPYWVGAVRYPSWKWTRDETHLYKRLGYTDHVARYAKTYVLRNNSANTCHAYCYNTLKNNSYYRYYGLKAIYCYCLALNEINVFNRTDVIRSTEKRCPGNYDEWCGDDVITVYESELKTFRPIRNGKCAYAIKYANETFFNATESCDTERSFACERIGTDAGVTGTDAGVTKTDEIGCHGKVCVRHGNLSWEDAAEKCKLSKVTESNLKSFTAAIQEYNQTDSSYTSYWTDLRSIVKKKWINGEDVVDDVDGDADNSYDMKCLTVQKNNGRIRLQWRNCSEKYKSICQIQTAKTNASYPNTDQGSTEVNNLKTNPGEMRALTGVQVTVTVVGTVIALLLITGAVIGIVYTRKKKICIKDNTDPDNFTNSKSPSKKNTNGRPKSENIYTNPAFEEGYETIDIVEPGSRSKNVYTNDAGISNEVDYDILSESEANVKYSNPYGKLSPDSEGYSDDYDITIRQASTGRDARTDDDYSRIRVSDTGISVSGASDAATIGMVVGDHGTHTCHNDVSGQTQTKSDCASKTVGRAGKSSKGELSSGRTTEADTINAEESVKESRNNANATPSTSKND